MAVLEQPTVVRAGPWRPPPEPMRTCIRCQNTLPLEIWAMTTTITSPALYAVGAVTTAVSFVVIITALTAIALIQRRHARTVQE